MKTPEDYRRDDVRKVFTKRLGEKIVTLAPGPITVSECPTRETTLVDFSFTQTTDSNTEIHQFFQSPGSGFVDAA